MEVFDLADKLKELRNNKKDKEEEIKDLNAEIESVEGQMVQAMLQEEMQNFNRGGTMFYMQTKVMASAIPERKPDLFEALKSNGFSDVVQETVNAQTLSSLVKEQIEEINEFNEEGKPILPVWLNGLVNVYEKQGIGMRKSAK